MNSVMVQTTENSLQFNDLKNSEQCNGPNNSEQCTGLKNSEQCNVLQNISPLHTPTITITGTTLQQCLPQLLKFRCSYQETTPNLAIKTNIFFVTIIKKTIQVQPNGSKLHIHISLRNVSVLQDHQHGIYICTAFQCN
jgi:hypothetical protein